MKLASPAFRCHSSKRRQDLVLPEHICGKMSLTGLDKKQLVLSIFGKCVGGQVVSLASGGERTFLFFANPHDLLHREICKGDGKGIVPIKYPGVP